MLSHRLEDLQATKTTPALHLEAMATKEAMTVLGGRDSRVLETRLRDAEQQMMARMAKAVEQIDTTQAKTATTEAVEVEGLEEAVDLVGVAVVLIVSSLIRN